MILFGNGPIFSPVYQNYEKAMIMFFKLNKFHIFYNTNQVCNCKNNINPSSLVQDETPPR